MNIPHLFDLLLVFMLCCSNDVCSSGKDYKMCPLCDEKIGCAYWYLSDVCTYVKIAYLFDHPATVAYAVFVSFWGIEKFMTAQFNLHFFLIREHLKFKTIELKIHKVWFIVILIVVTQKLWRFWSIGKGRMPVLLITGTSWTLKMKRSLVFYALISFLQR